MSENGGGWRLASGNAFPHFCDELSASDVPLWGPNFSILLGRAGGLGAVRKGEGTAPAGVCLFWKKAGHQESSLLKLGECCCMW